MVSNKIGKMMIWRTLNKIGRMVSNKIGKRLPIGNWSILNLSLGGRIDWIYRKRTSHRIDRWVFYKDWRWRKKYRICIWDLNCYWKRKKNDMTWIWALNNYLRPVKWYWICIELKECWKMTDCMRHIFF